MVHGKATSLVGKNKGHPAVFPVALPAFFIKLLSPPSGLVVDPFAGSGTTGIAAMQLGRDCVLIDNNIKYCEIAYESMLSQNKKNEYLIEFLASGMPAPYNNKTRANVSAQLLLIKEHLRAYTNKRLERKHR